MYIAAFLIIAEKVHHDSYSISLPSFKTTAPTNAAGLRAMLILLVSQCIQDPKIGFDLGTSRKAGVATLTMNKLNFKIKISDQIKKDKHAHKFSNLNMHTDMHTITTRLMKRT